MVQVSAHQIALNFSSLVFMVPLSFGIGLITRVGQALGEGDPVAGALRRPGSGVGMSLAFGVLSAALHRRCSAGRSRAPTPPTRRCRQLCAHLLLFAALFQLSDATQVATAVGHPRLQGDAPADA